MVHNAKPNDKTSGHVEIPPISGKSFSDVVALGLPHHLTCKLRRSRYNNKQSMDWCKGKSTGNHIDYS